MAQLLVRGLEPGTIDRLKERAKQHNRSLQGEVKRILEEAAHQMTMEEFKTRARTIRKSFGDRTLSDSTGLIREDRDR